MRNFFHLLYCYPRSVWRRKHYRQPFWRDDHAAKLLGISHLGCSYCGKGAA